MSPAVIARFRSKVRELGPDECWPWRAHLSKGRLTQSQIGERFGVSQSVVSRVIGGGLWQ